MERCKIDMSRNHTEKQVIKMDIFKKVFTIKVVSKNRSCML